ncbi:MAG: ROK family protein [Polyangiaceae bacterium]
MKVGVDFGGTRIKAGRVEGGRVVQAAVTDTRAGAAPGEILDQIAASVSELGALTSDVGVAIPGEVDAEGRCYRLPNVPGFEGVNIAAELGVRLGRQVLVEHDSTTAALGELHFGHGRSYRSFLVLTLGTGAGGGLVLGGRLHRGAHGFAAEVGHVVIDTSAAALPCVCGQKGCMETMAGTRGLLTRYQELSGEAVGEPRAIGERAARGEAAARQTFADMGRALGAALAMVQNVLDLEALVFTGGISRAFEHIEPSLRTTLVARAFGAPAAHVPLLVSELGENAGVLGAAMLGE